MGNVALHRQALILRQQKKSYSQIKAILGVSKSTLSQWLREYPLTREEINGLRAKSEIRIEKYRQTMQKKREMRLDLCRKEQKQNLLPLSKRDVLIAGLFLYWGEGNKASRNVVSINNTDPKLVKFALHWLIHALDISKDKIKVYVHLYEDMNIQEELIYWSKILAIPLQQFSQPYIKPSKRSDIDQKGFGHGTCGIQVCDTTLKEKISTGIQVIAEHYMRKFS